MADREEDIAGGTRFLLLLDVLVNRSGRAFGIKRAYKRVDDAREWLSVRVKGV